MGFFERGRAGIDSGGEFNADGTNGGGVAGGGGSLHGDGSPIGVCAGDAAVGGERNGAGGVRDHRVNGRDPFGASGNVFQRQPAGPGI